ncbi:MAG TPA: UDP-N-acetylmuramoyl-L-alanine--D-glutamate ligase [Alcanivoracaceae bacterium]|nr:UDP-N-acetylmuramoyl-L-alanine--D-glutamate ligase [Alcanivoracaceae bacterium]
MSNNMYDLVIGLGITGQSCVRYLRSQNMPVRVLDTRTNPAGLQEFKEASPEVPVHLGGWNKEWLAEARRLIVSPGVAIAQQPIAEQIALGKEVIGDVELFARAVTGSVAAITGSNAKSTVTALLGAMSVEAHRSTEVGGNFGVPALDMLEVGADIYVLELSSFQLETTYSLGAQVAAFLNVSQDHLDRYRSLADYIAAKQRIFDGCQVAVWNRDDLVTRPQGRVAREITFGVHQAADYRLDVRSGYLYRQQQRLIHVSDLSVQGHHNVLNVLSALAMAEALELPLYNSLKAAVEFKGLAHRCQLVHEANGVSWFNDSKGTNVGATLAALEGIGGATEGKLVLIAGGQGKEQDFTPLTEPVAEQVRHTLLLGVDKEKIAAVLPAGTYEFVETMHEAVTRAQALAQPGDAVLLSPACASLDMYNSYQARGEAFVAAVEEVLS